MRPWCIALALALAPGLGGGLAQPAPGETELPETVLEAPARPAPLPPAASERRVDGAALAARPLTRPGEVLEAAPGLIATQHSG